VDLLIPPALRVKKRKRRKTSPRRRKRTRPSKRCLVEIKTFYWFSGVRIDSDFNHWSLATGHIGDRWRKLRNSTVIIAYSNRDVGPFKPRRFDDIILHNFQILNKILQLVVLSNKVGVIFSCRLKRNNCARFRS